MLDGYLHPADAAPDEGGEEGGVGAAEVKPRLATLPHGLEVGRLPPPPAHLRSPDITVQSKLWWLGVQHTLRNMKRFMFFGQFNK